MWCCCCLISLGCLLTRSIRVCFVSCNIFNPKVASVIRILSYVFVTNFHPSCCSLIILSEAKWQNLKFPEAPAKYTYVHFPGGSREKPRGSGVWAEVGRNWLSLFCRPIHPPLGHLHWSFHPRPAALAALPKKKAMTMDFTKPSYVSSGGGSGRVCGIDLVPVVRDGGWRG
jgi:hypothetical protein